MRRVTPVERKKSRRRSRRELDGFVVLGRFLGDFC